MNIDVVIIWVDYNDPKWQKEYFKYKKNHKNESNLFRDWGTLKYVIRGIDKFMPWVNTIHLVTYGHVPEWINLKNDKLKLHTHEEIFFVKENLPVFNSSAIELNFLGIKNLAENFIYFNDDTLVLKETTIERFFKENKPVDFLIQEIPRKGKIYKTFFSSNVWVECINNSVELINRKVKKNSLNKNYFYEKSYGIKNISKNLFWNFFKKYYHFKHYHHPQSYQKETLRIVFELYKERILETSSKKFISCRDITMYINRYYHLATGNFFPQLNNDYYEYNIKNYKDALSIVKKIKKYRFLCVNDSEKLNDGEYEKSKKLITEKLNEILGEKSQFEI